jgi:hypothetical protein
LPVQRARPSYGPARPSPLKAAATAPVRHTPR